MYVSKACAAKCVLVGLVALVLVMGAGCAPSSGSKADSGAATSTQKPTSPSSYELQEGLTYEIEGVVRLKYVPAGKDWPSDRYWAYLELPTTATIRGGAGTVSQDRLELASDANWANESPLHVLSLPEWEGCENQSVTIRGKLVQSSGNAYALDPYKLSDAVLVSE